MKPKRQLQTKFQFKMTDSNTCPLFLPSKVTLKQEGPQNTRETSPFKDVQATINKDQDWGRNNVQTELSVRII